MKLLKIKLQKQESVLYEVYKDFFLHRIQYDDETTQKFDST